jgi:hypothetical protein
MATPDEVAEESTRVRKVRHTVDFAANLIMQGNMTRPDAEALVRVVRARVLALFPDGADTFELIYGSRFRRLVDEFAPAVDRQPGVVAPFPSVNHRG